MKKYYIGYLGFDYKHRYITNSISTNKYKTMQVLEEYANQNKINHHLRISVITEKQLNQLPLIKQYLESV